MKTFLAASPLNCFFDYDAPPAHRKWYIAKSQRRNYEFRQLDFSPFDIVYGHYPIARYNHHDNVVLLLRDPVERLVSQYNYFKYLVPTKNKLALAQEPFIEQIKNGELSIGRFAAKAEMNSFYYRYLSYPDTRNFLFVCEYFEIKAATDFICDYFGIPNTRLVSTDRRNTKKDTLSNAERKFLDNFLTEETAWFQKQVARS